MKSMGDVVAEAPAKGVEIGLLRRVSIDSVDRPPPAVPYSGPGELRTRTLRSLKRGLGKLWRRHRGNASITEYDPSYKVAYLGNVLTGWAKGEGCVEKPVSTLWRNYVSSSRPDVSMRLTVTNGGLTATTKDHGLTEYWAHRVTYCTAPASHPRLFVWVYRHEGRRLRPELRCHAALCSKESTARRLATVLNARLQQALLEFRRDKVSKQNARLSLANAVYENPSLPRRKILLSTGGSNYRPPLERSKSAPKLSAIEEDAVAEEIEQQRFLDELRSLEHVARTWQEQEGWRLARLLDALHRESSDENGSISSGCETASTANSEERVSSSEDSHLPHEPDLLNGQRLNCSKSSVTTPTMTSTATTPKTPTLPISPLCSAVGIQQLTGPRRNSEGSLNFMSCAISPRFRRRSSRQTRRRNRKLLMMSGGCGSGGSGGSSLSLSRSEGEESLEDEDEDEDGLMMLEDASGSPAVSATANYYDYEDVEDLQEIVDFRPHGETVRTSCGVVGGVGGSSGCSSGGGGGGGSGGGSGGCGGGFSGGGGSGGCGGGGSAGQVANRLQTESYAALMARRDEVRKLISCRRACPGRDEIDACVKDEVSCRTYVSPKTLASTPVSSTTPASTMPTAVVFHTLGSLDEEEADSDESGYVEASPKSSMDRAELKSRKEEQLDKEQQQQQQPTTTSAIATEANEETPTKTSEHAEFIKCPISETIKKLANASLRSSKAMRASTGARIEALGKSVATKPEIDGESPSLVQRKRLLAQQGVTV